MQAAIRELKLCTTVDSPELREMGVRLELNKDTGKLALVRREEEGGHG
jgi:hypothetical protein